MRPIREREQRERALADRRERIEQCARAIDLDAKFGSSDVGRDETEEACELARSALTALPPGASDRQMCAALERAITPVVERITQRRAQKEGANEITHRLRMLPWLRHSPKNA